MAISTRRGPPVAAQATTQIRRQRATVAAAAPRPQTAPAAAVSAEKPAENREPDNNETLEVEQRGNREMRATGTISASTSTSSSRTTHTPPASSSTSGGSTDALPVIVGDGDRNNGGDVAVRLTGTNKRLRVAARSATVDLRELTDFGMQNEQETGKGDGDVTMRGVDAHSGSNGGDTTSVQAGERTEDAEMQQEILLRIADLSSKNQQLSGDIEMLKRNFTLRQAETNRLLVGMGALNKVETELGILQREYRDCARNNVALIQDALRRISYCSSQVDTLTSGGNVTATQLQSFRRECSREMDDLLLKLEDVESGQQQQQDQVDLNNLSTLGEVRRNRYEIEQLKHEINACKRFMTGGNSGSGLSGNTGADALSATAALATGADGELLARIDKFTTQLEDLHNEMAMLKQFLLQESSASRSGIEKLLSRQMNDFQELQDDETKRLQEEMDELRSELCDVLKEMHLLKERTRYLRPDCSAKPQKRPRNASANSRGQQQPHSMNRHSSAGGGSPEVCSTCSSCYGGSGSAREFSSIPPSHCSRAHCDPPHHCRYHYPIAADTGGGDRMERTEYAYPASLNITGAVSANQRSPSSSRSSSPRRPSDVVIQALKQYTVPAPETRSCPSPHFSSRSSSISGRISTNRGENGEPLPEEEVERRLLEQHRLFWIKEGAGEAK